MVDSEMFVNTDVDQAVVAAPAVGVNDGAGVDLAPNDRLQCSFGAMGDDLGVDFALAF